MATAPRPVTTSTAVVTSTCRTVRRRGGALLVVAMSPAACPASSAQTTRRPMGSVERPRYQDQVDPANGPLLKVLARLQALKRPTGTRNGALALAVGEREAIWAACSAPPRK